MEYVFQTLSPNCWHQAVELIIHSRGFCPPATLTRVLLVLTMIQNNLQSRIESFAQELEILVRQKVLAELQAVLGTGAAPAARRGRPAGSGKGPGRPRGRRSADLGDALPKFVDFVNKNPGKGISAIAAGAGLDLVVAKKAALKLLAAKAVRKEGERRGTVYNPGTGVIPAAGEGAAKPAKRGRRKA